MLLRAILVETERNDLMEQRELTWHQRGRLWLRLSIRTILTAVVLLLLFRGGPYLLSLFMPFVLAFLVAWMLNPLVRVLQKRMGVSRRILSFILVLVLFGFAGGILFAFSYNVIAEVAALANDWQTVWDGIRGGMDQIRSGLSGLLSLLPSDIAQTAEGLLDQLSEWLQTAGSNLFTRFAAQAGTRAMGIPSFAIALVVFIMAAYFIAADYPHLRFQVTERLSPEIRTFFRMIRTTAGAAFGGYFRAQLILSLGVFFILLLGFIVIRQPYSLLLAFLLAVLDFIPIVGAGTVMVPWAVISLFTGDLRKALSFLVIWGVIALFRRVGEPKVLGSQTGLSPVLSLVSIYIGMRLGGVPGMILGPILCLVFLNIYRSGVFDGAIADLKLAVRDTGALLKNGPKT